MFYKWFQNHRKRIIKTTNGSCTNIVYLSHHLVKNNRIVALEKLHSKEIYSLIIFQNISTPTAQQYFKTLFPHLNFDWKLIYLLPRILTKNISLRDFQYKVLNNVLYLNHKLFQFKVSTTSLCSYCNEHDETVQHIFSTCNEVIPLGTELKLYFVNNIKLIANMSTDFHFGLYRYWWQLLHNSKHDSANFLNVTYISQEAVATWVLVLSYKVL